MGWLRDWFDTVKESLSKVIGISRKSLAIRQFQGCRGEKCVEKQWNALTSEEQSDLEIVAAHEDALERVGAEGGLGILGPLPGVLYEGLKDLTEDMSDAAGAAIADSYTKLFSTLTGQPLSKDAKKKLAGTNVPEAIEGIMDSIVDVTMLPFDKGAEALDKKIPETAKTAIREIVKLGAGLGATIGLGGYIMEHFHPTKSTNAARSLHMILEMVGFKTLSDAYIKPLRYSLIELPMRYKWNSLIRSRIPPFPDALEWYGRGHISEDEMEDLIKKHGIEDGWERSYQRMGTKPSSYFMLNAIGKEGLYDESDFKFWLSDAGYGAFQITKETLSTYEKEYELDPPKTTQIDFLAATYKRMAERVEWAGIQVLSKKAVKEGLMDVETLRTHLARGYRKKEVDDLEIELLEMDIKEEVDKEYRRAYEKKYLSGRITKEELEKLFVKHGLQEERAKARLEYMFARKQGKLAVEEDERVLTKAEVFRAYNLNQKGKGWAIKQIDAQGYTTEDASLLVDRIDVEKADDVTDEWVRAAETRTLNGRMTIPELTKRYIELGKEEDWAEARAAYIEERLLG